MAKVLEHRPTASKALLLGSGYVAKPCLDILAKSGIQVTVGELPGPGPFMGSVKIGGG